MPVATDIYMASDQSEEDVKEPWKLGRVKDMVNYFATLDNNNHSVLVLNGTDPSIPAQNNLQPQLNNSKVSLNSRDNTVINNYVGKTTQGHHQNGDIVDVHTSNGVTQNSAIQKTPSYVKIGSTISGYNKYEKQTASSNSTINKNTAKDQQNIEIATNNNILTHNSSYEVDNQDQVYSPHGSNFVKGISQRYESLNTSDGGKNAAEWNNVNSNGSRSFKPKGNTVSPSHMESRSQGAITHSPPLNNLNSADSKALSKFANKRNINSTSNVLSKPTNYDDAVDCNGSDIIVDSQNIDFRQARKAFVTTSSQPVGLGRSVKKSGSPSSKLDPHSNSGATYTTDINNRVDLDNNKSSSNINSTPYQHEVSVEKRNTYDITDNISVADRNHSNDIIPSIDLLANKDSNDVFDTTQNQVAKNRDHQHHIIQNGFLEEDINHISTPSEVKINAFIHNSHKDQTLQQKILINKSNASLDSNISLLSSDLQGGALSCQSSTEGLSSSSSSLNLKGGQYFLNLVELEEDKLNDLCSHTENYLQNDSLSDEVSGKLRAVIGKSHLLTTKKFKQFKGLCNQNMNPSDDSSFQTTAQDLAGFWDMVMIQVEEVKDQFTEISKLSKNNWKASPKQSPLPRKSHSSTSSTPKSTPSKKAVKATPMSAKAQEAAKARAEARRKLIEAKKAGRQQRKTSESEESVEIFVS